MDIPGYTYIIHKLIQRPWGPECRFTVARPDGTQINDVIMIPSMNIAETDLSTLILADCQRIDTPEPIMPTEQYEVLNQDGTTSVIEVPV